MYRDGGVTRNTEWVKDLMCVNDEIKGISLDCSTSQTFHL